MNNLCSFVEIHNDFDNDIDPQMCYSISKTYIGNESSWKLRVLDPIEQLVRLSKKKFKKKFKLLLLTDELTLMDSSFISLSQLLAKTAKLKIVCFKCPTYQNRNSTYPSVFGNFVRFYFSCLTDASIRSFPTICLGTVKETEKLYDAFGLIEKLNLTVDFLYISKIGNEVSPVWESLQSKHRIILPYMDAATFCAYRPFDASVLIQFLENFSRKKPLQSWVYGRLYKPLDHGVDDVFANLYLLPHLYASGFKIAWYEKFDIATPFFYFRDHILKDDRTLFLLGSVFGDLLRVDDVDNTLAELDILFYNVVKASSEEQKHLLATARQFWKVLEIYPDWFPLWYTKRILKFKGKLFGEAVVIAQQGQSEQHYFISSR